MKKLLFAFAAFLVPALVQAQPIPIQGHPQKLFYASEAERFILDEQCQWRQKPAPLGIIDPNWQHTHIRLHTFLYQRIDGTELIRVPFDLVLKNTEGFASIDLARQELVVKIEWDDIGEQSYRALPGDATSVLTWSGYITYDPRIDHGGHKFSPKGWYPPQFEVTTFYDTGADVLQLVRLPFYGVLDPNAPEDGHYPVLIGSCYPHTATIKEWGTNYVEIDTFLPLNPISAIWRMIATSAAYGGNEIGMGTWRVLADFDLHHGISGRVLDEQHEENFKGADRAPVLDPAVLGPGTHPVAFVWSKPTRDNSEEVIALTKFTVTVDPNAPVPQLCEDPTANNQGQPLPCTFNPPPVQLCQDPTANNQGQPLPCTFNPPSPKLDWQSFGLGTWNVSFEREVDVTTGTATGRQRACIGGQCIFVPLQ